MSFPSQPTKGACYQYDLSALMLTLIAGLSYYLSVSFSSRFNLLKATFHTIGESQCLKWKHKILWFPRALKFLYKLYRDLSVLHVRLIISPFRYLTIHSTYTENIYFILCVPKQSKTVYFASDIVLILLFGTLNVFCFEYEHIFWCGKVQDALSSFCNILFPSSIMSHLFKHP